MSGKNIIESISQVSKDFTDEIKKNGWTEETVFSFDREDLNEILPGTQHLLTRKKIFKLIQEFKNVSTSVQLSPISSTPSSSYETSNTSSVSLNDTPPPEMDSFVTAKLKAKRVYCAPEFPIYTDSELRLFAGKPCMSKALEQRLYQSTVSNMISTTQNLTPPRDPTFRELEDMAMKLCQIYPALTKNNSHEVFFMKMRRRFQNVRPVKKPQGKMPQRSRYYQAQLVASAIDDVGVEPVEHQIQESHFQIEDTLLDKVQDVCGQDPAERNLSNLNEEMHKKSPDADTIQFYMDLLFDKRRQNIMDVEVQDRFGFLQEKYPVLLKEPRQMIQEVRRLLDYDNVMFIEKSISRLKDAVDSLIFLACSKLNMMTGFVMPIANSKSSKLISLLGVIDQVFEKKKKDLRKRKLVIVQVLEHNEDPQKRPKVSQHVPNIVVERSTGKACVFIGNKLLFTTNDTDVGFLAFLSLFYILDMDYPLGYVMCLSIFHRIVFLDNRIVETHIEQYNACWEEISSFIRHEL